LELLQLRNDRAIGRQKAIDLGLKVYESLLKSNLLFLEVQLQVRPHLHGNVGSAKPV
jgi:hypothetical protein